MRGRQTMRLINAGLFLGAVALSLIYGVQARTRWQVAEPWILLVAIAALVGFVICVELVYAIAAWIRVGEDDGSRFGTARRPSAPEPPVANVVYEGGIPGWQKSPIESLMNRGTKLRLAPDALQVTRGKRSLSIPTAAIKNVSLQRGLNWSNGNALSVVYDDPSTGQSTTAIFRFPGIRGGSITGERIVEGLRKAGVLETDFVPDGDEDGPHTDRRPGLFAPWHAREPGPLVVKKYGDNWAGRNSMNREIREAGKSGWAVQQTQTVAGHVNVGTVIMMILFFWTIIIPIMALLNLRTPGHFVVTFEKKGQPSDATNEHRLEPESAIVTPSRDLAASLRQLKELREQDLITEQEFEAKRKQLIESAFPGSSQQSA